MGTHPPQTYLLFRKLLIILVIMYGDSKVGDLFCEVNGRHCYVEVIEYKGKLGFRGLMSGGKIRSTPLWAMPPGSLRYMGNGDISRH